MSDFRMSFKDIKGIEPFQQLSEFDLAHPSADKLVAPYLHLFGCDLDYPIGVEANLHRTRGNEVHLGYMWTGSLRHDTEWVDGPLCSWIERLSALSFYRADLVFEIIQLTGGRVSYSIFDGIDNSSGHKLEACNISDDYEANTVLINQLNEIAQRIRGELH